MYKRQVYVGRLRKKLGASPLRITTVRSLGYRADVEQDPDSGSPTAREHGAEPGTSHGSGQSGA